MADLVESVLQAAAEKDSRYKSIEVEKQLDLEIDEGNLLAVDKNPIELRDFRSNQEAFLKVLARDNTQLLFNQIWQLPVTRVEDAVVAQLPDPTTILPREKPVPKPKPETKWEQFAKLKRIQKTKKGRMVWDEELKEYRPRWGYKRANDEMRDWVLEVPQNADPYEDQFEKRKTAKKERLAKNELQRLRNIARHMKGKVPGVGLTPTEAPDKDHLKKALVEAKRSTASVGKFTQDLPKEKPLKSTGKKRKFESNFGDVSDEKRKALDIFGGLQKHRPTMDNMKAANQFIAQEERQRGAAKKDGKKKEGKGGKGGQKKQKGGKGRQKGKQGKKRGRK